MSSSGAQRHLVRFRSPGGHQRPVGAGVLLAGRYVLTAAHVVNSALGRSQFAAAAPDVEVACDLPALPELGMLRAGLVAGAWLPPDDAWPEDVAVLCLDRQVLAPGDTPVLRTRVGDGQDFSCYGFPGGRPVPVLAVGTVQGAMGPDFGWHQLVVQGGSGYQVEAGFSGAPVCSGPAGAVVGIVVTEDSDRERRVGCMLPLHRFAGLPGLAEALAESLRFDPAAYDSHWEPAVRGTRTSGTAWYFTGRHTVLADLSGWLRRDGDDQVPACVVTGPPGTGKSAVLARVATLASAAFRQQHPDAWSGVPDGTVPPEGAVDVAVHARALHLADVCAAVAEAAGLPDPRPERLVPALCAREEPFGIVLDALDEAADGGREIINGLVRPLVAYGDPRRLRLIVGTRPHLVEELGGGFAVIELDDPRYAELDDLVAYTSARLGPGDLAVQVAVSAFPLFLVAQLTVDALTAPGAGGGTAGAWPLPTTVAQALDAYLLRAFTADDARRARDLLRPLALAEGDGLPAGPLWAGLAGRLADRYYQPADVAWLLDRAPALLTTSAGSDGRGRHRLFHAAFAESVSPDPAALTGAFLDGLLDAVPVRADGQRDWPTAPTYVRRHLAHHALAAGRLEDLRGEAGFLSVADPGDVLRAQEHSGHPLGREISHVLAGFAARPVPEPPQERAAAIALRLQYRGRADLASDVLRAVGAAGWRPLWFQGPPAGTADSHQGAVRGAVTLSIDGAIVLVSCADDGALLVRPITGEARSSAVETVLAPPTVVDAHVGGVTAVAVTAGAETMVVTGGVDGSLAFWDPVTWSEVRRLPGAHEGPVTGFAAVGEVLVSAGADGTLRGWFTTDLDYYDNPMLVHAGGVIGIGAAAFGPGGAAVIVTVGVDDRMCFWEPADGTSLGEIDIDPHGRLTVFDLCAVDGIGHAVTGTDEGSYSTWVITATDDGNFNTRTERSTVSGRPPITAGCVVAGPQGPVSVVGAGTDLFAERFGEQVSAGAPSLDIHTVEGVSVLTGLFGAAGAPMVVVGGHNGTLRVWSLEEEGLPAVRDGRTSVPSTVTALAVADAGPFVAVARGGSGGYRTVLQYETSATTTVSTSMATRMQPTVEVLGTADGAPAGPARRLNAPAVLALTFAPARDGTWRFSAAGRDGTCRSWRTGEAQVQERELLPAWIGESFDQVVAVTAGPAAIVAANDEGGLWVLDAGGTRSWRRRRVPRSHKATVVSTGVLGGRDVIVSWSVEEHAAVYVWDLGSGRQLARLVDDRIVRISALAVRDGLLAAGGFDGAVTLFHLDDRLAAIAVTVHGGHTARVSALCALRLPSGAPVTVSGGQDGDVRFWPQPRAGEHPASVSLGTPVQCLSAGGPGILVVGTDLGVQALRIGA